MVSTRRIYHRYPHFLRECSPPRPRLFPSPSASVPLPIRERSPPHPRVFRFASEGVPLRLRGCSAPPPRVFRSLRECSVPVDAPSPPRRSRAPGARAPALRCPEHQLTVGDVDGDGVAGADVTPQEREGEAVGELLLDDAPQRASAVDGVIAHVAQGLRAAAVSVTSMPRSRTRAVSCATWSSTISEICSRVSGSKRTMSSRRLMNSGFRYWSSALRSSVSVTPLGTGCWRS